MKLQKALSTMSAPWLAGERGLVALEKIKNMGWTTLIADDEPIELKKVWAHFPTAQGILLDRPFSGVPAELPEETLLVKNFEALLGAV